VSFGIMFFNFSSFVGMLL